MNKAAELSLDSHSASSNFSAETTVEAKCVSKVYWDGDRTLEVLKNISLSAQKGQGVAVLGPSGSGKSTLLNVLSGLDRATSGAVRLGGVDLGALSEAERADFRNRRLGFVFQFYHLLPEFTALENTFLPALLRKDRYARQKYRDRADSLLEKVGLKKRLGHFPSELSGGEQQRVAIARALMNDPDILFCDEPTGNLDAETGSGIVELLRDLFEKEKKTVLMVTHDPALAKIATRVWDMTRKDWLDR